MNTTWRYDITNHLAGNTVPSTSGQPRIGHYHLDDENIIIELNATWNRPLNHDEKLLS
jgi:hypothetical protein